MALQPNLTSNVTINGKDYNTYTEPSVALAGERAKTKFDVRQLTYFLDGGKEITEKLESFATTIERDPTFSNDDSYDLPLEKAREVTMKHVAKVAEYTFQVSGDVQEIARRMSIVSLVSQSALTRIRIYLGLFMNGIRGSGTDAQISYWESKGASNAKKFYGCFAMTELGHGSNVAGLETTATFDRQTDEFIINTPHSGACKWWIGGAAHTATHALVFARLIVDGKDYGVKNFVVPLRNVHDHSLKQGIALGDIGKKMGRDGVDNGWIQFSNVRIPRTFMLMRYAKVDRNGKVTEPPMAQLAYGPLIIGRVNISLDSFSVGKRFITIAIRYAAARRQFGSDPHAPESKILDYTHHQRRLLPRLAYLYAMKAGVDELLDLQYSTTSKLDNLQTSSDKATLSSVLADLKDLFAQSAGIKAFSTWATSEIIDECRQACGGHGYSAYNGFGQGYGDWAVNCTWEGDNNVLCLSNGRALIQKGLKKTLPVRCKSLGRRDIRDFDVILEAWESVSSQAINHAVALYRELTKSLNPTQAFEELSQHRFEIARINTRYFFVRAFINRIQKAKDDGTDGSIIDVLSDLARLFSLWSIEKEGAFLKYGFITSDQLDQITDHVDSYCKRVREQAIGLTDAFNLSDFMINSPIGNYDGDVYKNYFSKVTRRNNPRKNFKAPYHDQLIKPFLFRKEDSPIDRSELE
ncbi:acyl-CoA oxidase [Sugiyamaella lignohabitans]|uniref:Acyl-coenzyme A oxidase n=1 Tax=Sugiyamaella lignohabitans TaxID=796027 RepID=A0A161HNJ3_9ASCO|nr:acyl-CoA oxidase [Sugiyamaella lignohabitans]ANB15717.1 acyl-CoA oxidase [Sugiyamaella lignohabitans]